MKLSTHLIAISCAWLACSQLIVQDSSTSTLHREALTSDPYPGFSVDLQERRLLKFEDGSEVWMSELEKLELKMRGERFFDMYVVPESYNGLLNIVSARRLPAYTATPMVPRKLSPVRGWYLTKCLLMLLSLVSYPPLQFNGTVRDVIKTLSTDGPRTNLEKFTEFNTRCM